MMNLTILCIGKLKERYWTEAVCEYSKRLSRYCDLTVEELKEEKAPQNPSPAEEETVKQEEGRRMLSRVKDQAYVVALDVKGKALSSQELAFQVEQLGVEGKSSVVFLIGGSLGLSEEVLSRADFRLSFSKMTFPHQMMRVILLEQIYRSFKIIRKETYHK